ncbi:TetR/AcrR family transcriptional regulator [Nocardia jejuensis]|uniref:TetR/AcrR family transcriptional regulator n=1 Tax=Nocardia jejuensis TaxID=328049 RepID=UPI001FE0A659|nr:TetR/AcrR family transcriptional regulator [Nocardia jejuensis]
MPRTAPASANAPRTDATIEDRILDAALVQFEQVGVKKTTIEDIARKADVDRVTVYRRIGSRDDVVRAVTGREIQRLLAELREIPSRHATFEDIVTATFATVIMRWRSHALVERMVTLEPERLLPQLTTEGGTFFVISVHATADILRDVVHEKNFRELPDLVARVEVACRVVHSLILQPAGTIYLDSDEALADFAREYILPILTR